MRTLHMDYSINYIIYREYGISYTIYTLQCMSSKRRQYHRAYDSVL